MPHLQSLRNSLNIFLVNLRNNLSIRPVPLSLYTVDIRVHFSKGPCFHGVTVSGDIPPLIGRRSIMPLNHHMLPALEKKTVREIVHYSPPRRRDLFPSFLRSLSPSSRLILPAVPLSENRRQKKRKRRAKETVGRKDGNERAIGWD